MLNIVSGGEISSICGVSLSTTYRLRTQCQEIPTAAKKLLDLYASKQVIPENWNGYTFGDGMLWTPNGYHFSDGELTHYGMIMGFYRSARTENDQLREYITYLEGLVPKADVIPLPFERTRTSATEGKELNKLFNKSPD